MPRMLIVLAGLLSLASLAFAAAASADTVSTNFESFDLGTVNGQDGWKSAVPGDIPSLPNGYDQEVWANTAGAPAAFSGQSLRISNAYGTGPLTSPPEFHFQTYSKPTPGPAGEGETNTEYTAQFSFISIHPDRRQPGLKISVSPDMGEGGRMSYIGLDDMPDGIAVSFFETDGSKFVGYDLGTLRRDTVHTIKFWIKFNPGPDNDRVGIFIDGGGVGRCFTTWESFYVATSQSVPISDRLLFLSGNRDGDRLSLLHAGYLFDNVTTTTANGPGPAADCAPPIDIDKTTRTRFARPGDLITYRISVRNRGHAPVRGLRACDRVPRALRFVRATRHLRHAAGRRLCVRIRLRPGQRKTFRATFLLRASVTAETVTNGAGVDVPAGSAPTPVPPNAPITNPRRRRVARDAATIGVRGETAACPAALNPRAHAAC